MTATAPRATHPDDAELATLDAALERALDSGDESGLEVIGYGEISSVVAWRGPGGDAACKRLPLFDDAEQLAGYRRVFEDYVAALRARDVPVIASELRSLPRPDGRVSAYCIQPMLDAGALATARAHELGSGDAVALVDRVIDRILGCVGDTVGLDGQLSNWALDAGGDLIYLDVTTPMLRDDAGAERLDGKVFLASLPWLLRGAVRRFVLQGILDKYYEPRGVVVDLLGNLYKERLDHLLPELIERANGRLDRPVSAREVRRYYRGDARVWGLLQRLRRIDRAWQRRVRRRQYPFLLPGDIAR